MDERTADRFWAKVEKSTNCWEWQACLHSNGYGKLGVNGKTMLAHRVAYELSIGPIGADLTVDHLCRNRRCVNPDHLELVTRAENTRRGAPFNSGNSKAGDSHCIRGHEYTPANTVTDKRGWRSCRECRRASDRETKRRQRQAAKRRRELMLTA